MIDWLFTQPDTALVLVGAAQLIVFMCQLFVFGVQARRLKQQKIITENQSRAYIMVDLSDIIEQAPPLTRFQPTMFILNRGSTPAKNIKCFVKADILSFPLDMRPKFEFTENMLSGSFGIIGPQMRKKISASVSRMCHEIEVQQIKKGEGQRICIWGKISYEDTLGVDRWVRFSQSFRWSEINNERIISEDCDHYYNDSN